MWLITEYGLLFGLLDTYDDIIIIIKTFIKKDIFVLIKK